MNHIKALRIKEFKKFESFMISFNEHMNILVGENEAGKSTILEAIRIVLNQQYRNADKSILKDFFNIEAVNAFRKAPTLKTLPKIIIEIEFELDPKSKNAEYFYGEVYDLQKSQESKYGIRFVCSFDEENAPLLVQSIQEGKIPYEYYSLSWTTFGNKPYQALRRPLKFIPIDTSNSSTATSFNYYNRALFSGKYDEATQARAKNDFRSKLEDAFTSIDLPPLDDHRRFGIDGKKVILEAILSVYEDSIALENRGSGMESLIKTQIALDKQNGLDVILIEEPENHLSFSNLRKMLEEITERQSSSQIILATHNSMIASRLNLNNVIWITNDEAKSLSTIRTDTANFFVKAADNSFLQLLLSEKAFLVEGPTEYLLLPYFYEQITGRTIEKDGITVISCNGISYRRYLEIAEKTGKRIAVLTDNDKKQSRIDEAKTHNANSTDQHIFLGDTISEWTWEVCIFNANQNLLQKLLKPEVGAKYLVNGEDLGPFLGKMMNNKVETAFQMLNAGSSFEAPQYVKDAITWLCK